MRKYVPLSPERLQECREVILQLEDKITRQEAEEMAVRLQFPQRTFYGIAIKLRKIKDIRYD